MSTTRLTFGAVLATVNTTATVITSTLNAVDGASNILGSFINKAATEQGLRHIADKESFLERLINEKAQERAAANIAVTQFCAKSSAHAEHYANAYDTFTKLLRPTAE